MSLGTPALVATARFHRHTLQHPCRGCSWAGCSLGICLLEQFPNRVRSTGGGVTFNFGRVATAAGRLRSGALWNYFDNDYAKMGTVTSLVHAVGMLSAFLYQPATERLDEAA